MPSSATRQTARGDSGDKNPTPSSALFSTVPRSETASQTVLRQIIALLRSGRLRPGDRLPAERELAASLGISRPTVREALSALGLLGVVEQRQGRGTFLVDSMDRLPLEPYLYRLLLNRGTIDELREVRELLEPRIAALAAERATPEACEELKAAFEAFEREARENLDVESEAAAGTRFHEALARATGNATFVLLVHNLSDLMSATGRVLNEQEYGLSLEAHRDLLQAVVEHDPQRAEQVMTRHLADVATRLQAWASEETPRQ
jgi:GntR family transcriptional regulator, transcriptional repressor for pyruvate dehydrogenase complex